MKRGVAIGLAALALLAGGAAGVLYAQQMNGEALLALIAAMWLAGGAATAYRPIIGTVVSACMGAGVSAYLTYKHAIGAEGGACNINEVVNCDAVLQLPQAVVAGIPIALFGAGFYAAAAVIAALAWQEVDRFAHATVVVLVAAIAGLLADSYLLVVQVQENSFCVLCISTYGLSAVMALSAYLDMRTRDRSGPMTGDRSLIAAIGAGLLVVITGSLGTKAETPIEVVVDGDTDADITALYSKTAGPVALSDADACWGKPDAPYLLIEFADFECPHCAASFPELRPLVAANPDLRVCFKNYPLSNQCNPSVSRDMHPNACLAAAAAHCANDQGRFWELSEKMMANQRDITAIDILFWAEELGLSGDYMRECVMSETTGAKVGGDVASGNGAGVMATPSLFLRGVHPTDEWITVELGTEAVGVLLQAHRTGEVLPPAPPPEPLF
jgi:protein-disulfide isomerase